MARFLFEVCSLSQAAELTEYIDNNWVKDHVFVRSKELLDWQHKSRDGEHYNFVFARHNKTGKVCGVLGFIPSCHFSSELEQEKEAWLAIWKVNEGPKYVGLGLGLLTYLQQKFSMKNICSIGISPIVYPMYEALGYKVGVLSQFAIVNTTLKAFSIAKVPNNIENGQLVREGSYSIDFINHDKFAGYNFPDNFFQCKTQKNHEYFIKRYAMHPVYRYKFLGVYDSGVLVSFLTLRKVDCNGSSVLRVIDIQGALESVPKISGYLFDLLVSEGHEYLDIMQYGMNETHLLLSGFLDVKRTDGLVTPDYFQPFMQKNVDISFARKTENINGKFVLFKGDADQDRPNLL